MPMETNLSQNFSEKKAIFSELFSKEEATFEQTTGKGKEKKTEKVKVHVVFCHDPEELIRKIAELRKLDVKVIGKKIWGLMMAKEA